MPEFDAQLHEAKQEVARLRKNIKTLLSLVANAGECRRCGRAIWWVPMRSGKVNPFTDEGVSHFADCVGAADFRKAKA